MSTLIELTAQIVAQHAKKTSMTQEQLLQDMHLIHAALQLMEQGVSPEHQLEEPASPPLTIKQAFKKNEVICMVCNKGGLKTLKKHLSTAHQLTPGQYRKQFGIKSTQKLAAKSFSEERRVAAEARGMTDILAKAREKRMANIEAKKNVPAVKVKAPAPSRRVKASVPALKAKAAVPATKEKASVPAKRAKAAVPEKMKGK